MMDQISDVEYRAEKLYKNAREKFGYLIREVVSNSIHAVAIRKRNEETQKFVPKVSFKAIRNDDVITITISDNGDGFNDLNRKYFTRLDSRNAEKEKLRFHPKGQGRLALVYFSDNATYSSTHVGEQGEYQQRTFDYPERTASLFDVENIVGSPSEDDDTGTTLTITIKKQQTIGRANTFFNRYSKIEDLSDWFVGTFFPFFMEYEDLELNVTLDGNNRTISKPYIDKNVQKIPFGVNFGESDNPESFVLWLLKNHSTLKVKNQIVCFARHLRASLGGGGKLEYEIGLHEPYEWFLTSGYFDDNVDQKGDQIEIYLSDIEKIQAALTQALDGYFSSQIEENKKETRKNIDSVKKKYHSLSVFMDKAKGVESRKVVSEAEIVNSAVDEKGRVEESYWNSQEVESEELGKLLNSSLQIYIEHRNRILERFKELIPRIDGDGGEKREAENDVHDLFLRRGKNLRDTRDKAHLHNLWILDDKYTIFSETIQVASSKQGQAASDIYMWADDPSRTRELLILELKSTTSAHNAGNKYESMVAQVKRYASQFYKNPEKVLNWRCDPDRILYSGVILARKSDVYKELSSNNAPKSRKIPFLESSYYFDEDFIVGGNDGAAPRAIDIRIEMYSFEDIYELAYARNSVFFNLLKNEFEIE